MAIENFTGIDKRLRFTFDPDSMVLGRIHLRITNTFVGFHHGFLDSHKLKQTRALRQQMTMTTAPPMHPTKNYTNHRYIKFFKCSNTGRSRNWQVFKNEKIKKTCRYFFFKSVNKRTTYLLIYFTIKQIIKSMHNKQKKQKIKINY